MDVKTTPDTDREPDENVSRPSGSEDVVQEQIEEKRLKKPKLFGTFGGVFTPTLLTILGVIMYLREGWVVGNAGLLGAWSIIVLSFTITAFTGLSLSSIVTNIRVGAGGAFSVISQSLGLEVGGSVGIPLYLAQALAVSMYIFGFRAGWLWVFPDHSPLVVDFTVFGVLFAIAFISASLAFRIQYLILAVIVASLFSVAWAGFTGGMSHSVQWWGGFEGSPENDFSGIGYWAVFAVFFPASTGIMAGANMSGELKDPRKSIPVGTMSAIGLSLIVYLVLAWWLAASASTDDLLRNYTVMIDSAAWRPVVVAGLLGATFSSALSSLVGAPRILQAIAEHKILPGSGWFKEKTEAGEPRNALHTTALIVAGALMMRDLNAIAPLLTMFFLITYAMINMVVVIEQKLGLVSFRPLFNVPSLVPIIGGVGCVAAMFIVNPVFAGVAVVVVVILHAYLIRRHLKAPFGDVRSGLFVAVAEWAVRRMAELTGPMTRTWKANLLVPVEDSTQARERFALLRDVAYPKGFVKLLGLTGEKERSDLLENLPELTGALQEEGVFATWSLVDASYFGENLAAGMETLAGGFFRPNVLCLKMPESEKRTEEVRDLIRNAARIDVGVILYTEIIDRGDSVMVWIDDQGPDWEASMDLGNMDLALLTAIKLRDNWEARLTLTAWVNNDSETSKAQAYLESLAELTRLPNVDKVVMGESEEDLPETAIHVRSFDPDSDLNELRAWADTLGAPCIFAMDSGLENALA
ncbi:amino acid permease [Desulfopila inferna]|uniref:amino acid permease n=1 Tax=Desulfopila inferna TaxID=468528 RepID=UPI0019630440|nr:amino acid permease [Desulfopila inferna]MBM9606715.1 hypothetical protein [Desulfopila inferna]